MIVCPACRIFGEKLAMGYEIKQHTARCLECGDAIEYGRQDRKFCCVSCKNRFNNLKARGTRAIKMKIINALEKNHGILENLLKHHTTSLSVMELRHLGFNFDYVTSYHKTRRHDEYGCFDISVTVMSSKVSIARCSMLCKTLMEYENVSLNLQDISSKEI